MNEDKNAEQAPMNVDEKGIAVPRRVANARSAYSLMTSMIKSDDGRAKDRARIKGMIDGERPYSEKELTAKGMGWRFNVNWREAEGMVDSTTGSFTELVMETAELIDVNISPLSEIQDPDGSLCAIIEEEYTRLLNNWDDFVSNYSVMVGQFIRYGRGTYFWADPYNWKYTAVKTGNVLTAEGSGISVNKHQVILVRDMISPVRIYELIESPSSELAGWKGEELRKLLIDMRNEALGNDSQNRMANSYEAIRLEIANKDLGLDSASFREIPICYVLEESIATGEIRMSIIRADKTSDNYLYEFEDLYDSMSEALAMFFYSYGEGDFHSVRGLGHRIFAHVEASNRLLNSTLDGSVMDNSLLLSGNSSGVGDALSIARLGPITILPDSLQVITQSFRPNIDSSLGLRNVLHSSLNNNTGVNKAQTESTGPVERTAAGVRYRAGKEAGFSKNQTLLFYSQWDVYHREVFRRLLDESYPEEWEGFYEANEFRHRCLARGVPPELLFAGMFEVWTRRTVGNGSPIDKDTSTRELLELSASMPEDNAYNAMRDRASHLVGSSNVNRYFPKKKEGSVTNEHSIAQLENNDLFEGSVVKVGSDQRHTIHAEVHIEKLLQTAEQYIADPENADIMVVAKYMVGAHAHVGEHIQRMHANPVLRDDASVFEGAVKNVGPVLDKVMKAAEEFQKEQQQAVEQAGNEAQGEIDPELRMKLEKHQLDMQIRTQDAQSRMSLKKEMQDSTIRMREIKEAHRLSLQRARG